jgi:hypothetical protein
MTCPHARRLGVFALGVEDSDRTSFERHLATCATCRAELSELAALAPLLATVERADIANVEEQRATHPPDELLDRVLATISTERGTVRSSRRRRRLALAAAAVLIVGGTATGAVVAFQGSQAADQIQLVDGRSSMGVRATTSVLPEAWGTRIDMRLAGLPPRISCRLIARTDDGRTETAASWRVTYQDSIEVEGMTSLSPDDLAELEVIDDNGRRLITVPVRTAGEPPR